MAITSIIPSTAKFSEEKAAPTAKAVSQKTVWEEAKAGAIAALTKSITECEGLIKNGPQSKPAPSPCWSRRKPKKSEDSEIILEIGLKSGTSFVDGMFRNDKGEAFTKARATPEEALKWMKECLAYVESMDSKDANDTSKAIHAAVLSAKVNAQESRNNRPAGVDKDGNPRKKVIKKYNPATDRIEAV